MVHKSGRSEDSLECWSLGTFYLSLTSVSHWPELHSVGEATDPQAPRDLRGSTPCLTMARIPGIYHLTWVLYEQVLTNQTISPVPYSEIALMTIYEYLFINYHKINYVEYAYNFSKIYSFRIFLILI